MRRACFLCGGEALPRHTARFELPGLGARELGFGACDGCGLVLQSPCASPGDLARWYAESAVYTNPGRGGEPHPRKVRGTTRFVNAVRHALGEVPASVVQVGSSDGYTLSRFRAAGSALVVGLDPSAAACELARERYGVEALVGTVESPPDLPPSDLWVLTHVLEHLHDPLAALRVARAASAPGGGAPWVAVEVPLFERPESLPPGYLSFEHLTYFTEESLARTLGAAGFEVVGLDKQYADDIYPVVAAVARPGEVRDAPPEPGERGRATARLDALLARERSAWAGLAERLRREVPAGRPVWLFGAGVFAAQVLASTDLARVPGVAGVLDSSPQKHGSRLGPHAVRAPRDVALDAGDTVVITSFASADEIWRGLAAERERGVRVVRLAFDA